MKKIISLLMGVGLLGLVAGCSDDGGDVSCSLSANGTVQYCMTGDITESDCTGSTTAGSGVTAAVVDSCPGGSVSSCTMSGNGKSATAYFYTQEMVTALSGMCSK
jgi:hypothetical protein